MLYPPTKRRCRMKLIDFVLKNYEMLRARLAYRLSQKGLDINTATVKEKMKVLDELFAEGGKNG